MAKPIGTIGNVPTILVGGRVFVDLTNLIYLFGFNSNVNLFATLRLANATAGYQVSGTLTTYAVDGLFESGILKAVLLYGDTDVGFSAGAAPTNPVYLAGDTAMKVLVSNNTYSKSFAMNFQTPNTKYPCIKAIGDAGSFAAYAYL